MQYTLHFTNLFEQECFLVVKLLVIRSIVVKVGQEGDHLVLVLAQDVGDRF